MSGKMPLATGILIWIVALLAVFALSLFLLMEATSEIAMAAFGLSGVVCTLTAFMYASRLSHAKNLFHRLGLGETDFSLEELQELGESGAWAHAAAKRLSGLEDDVQRLRSALAASPIPIFICDYQGNMQIGSTSVMLGFATLNYGNAENDLQALVGHDNATMVLERRSLKRERVDLPHALAGMGPGPVLLFSADLDKQKRLMIMLTETV